MIKVRAPKEFWSGVLFMAIGMAGVYFARDYPFGSALRMGPGYLPTVLSWCTAGFGGIVFLRSFVIAGPPLDGVQWRPLALVLGSIVTFGAVISLAGGLVAAIVVSALIGGFASDELSMVERIGLSVGLAAFCVAVFVYGLGQPIDLWPKGLGI